MAAPRDYTLAEQQAGLVALATFAGQAGPASRALRAQGIDVPESTLRSWAESKREQYDEIREKYGRRLEDEAIRCMREVLLYGQRVILKAVVEAEARIDARKEINPAQTAASIARVVGTEADKLLAFTGRPVSPSSDRSAEDIIAALEARGLLAAPPRRVPAIASPADEVPDVEVVSG